MSQLSQLSQFIQKFCRVCPSAHPERAEPGWFCRPWAEGDVGAQGSLNTVATGLAGWVLISTGCLALGSLGQEGWHALTSGHPPLM